MKKNLYEIKEISLIALFVTIITICSWINIPTVVPFTMQTFAVFTAAGVLGIKNGVTAIIVYCLLGAAGLPVFSGFRGGITFLFGTTGGYIIGFIFSVAIIGIITKIFGRKNFVLAISMIIGMILCYGIGTAWFILVYTNNQGTVGMMSALSICVFPYVIPDIIKIALAILATNRINKYLATSHFI